MVFFAPEVLKTSAFRKFLGTKAVRSRLALLGVDECHLVDEWGADFRKDYSRIRFVRPWLPPWTSVVCLTATLEPGRQTDSIVRAVGLRPGGFHFEKRDCERQNVDIVVRTVSHTTTTHEFLDLDWLIPADVRKVVDIPKTLLYCEAIDLCKRVAKYLRSLLPQHLRKDQNSVIRLVHSLNCPQCKDDILVSLYQSGNERTTGIHVTTDVLGVGMNMQDFDRIICFPTPSSAASLVQRAGRASRGRDRHGTAYVYIKKNDIKDVSAYLKATASVALDPRLLRDPVSTPSAANIHAEHGTGGILDTSTVPVTQDEGSSGPSTAAVVTSGQLQNTRTTKTVAQKSPAISPKLCPSLRLIIAAHIQQVCITRQINMIYRNLKVDVNCRRCSSCSPVPEPSPRPRPLTTMSTNPPSSETVLADCDGTPPAIKDSTPAYMKLIQKDVADVTAQLQDLACDLQIAGPWRPEFIGISPECFLPLPYIQRITHNFHLITSKARLEERVAGWDYWLDYGDGLWVGLQKIQASVREKLEARHQASLERRRETQRLKADEKEVQVPPTKVRAALAAANIVGVKRVILRLPTVTHTAKENQSDIENPTPSSSSEPLSPSLKRQPDDQLYSPSRRDKRRRSERLNKF